MNRFGSPMSGTQIHAESDDYAGQSACDSRVTLDMALRPLLSFARSEWCSRIACERRLENIARAEYSRKTQGES